MSDNVSIWSWRALLTQSVRYGCQILNLVACVSHSNDSSLKESCWGGFWNTPPRSSHGTHKNTFTTLFGIVFYFRTKSFLNWHFTLIYNNKCDWISLSVQAQLTGSLSSTWGGRNTILCFVRQPGERSVILTCVASVRSAHPAGLLSSLSLSFFFFFPWHKSRRWKCHGAGSFCKEVLIAMLV